MNYVLDACAEIAFFRKEEGHSIVRDLLYDYRSNLYMHAVNLCEVYYEFAREENSDVANDVIKDTIIAGIDVREDLDSALWRAAGDLKAKFRRISLADTLAIALANRLDATLVTSDHSEFDKMADQKICKILFIR